jgi:putative NADPH-quinone reductase
MSGATAVLVVAHPCDDSYCRALADAAERGLVGNGAIVDRIDLYEAGFRAAMTRDERMAYETDDPILDPLVRDHARRIVAAETLVFVYPTWWAGPPAILKGWLERVMVPGVGFTFDERSGKVRPGLTQVRRIVGISTYGSPRWYVASITDGGRRIVTRALRMSCGWRARTTWLALYALDTTTDDQRRRFLERVERKMGAL